jgi:hypothetical protein
MRHFWPISSAIAPSRSRFVCICYRIARSVTSGHIGKLDTKIGALTGYLKLIIWATGINAAATIGVFGILLHR